MGMSASVRQIGCDCHRRFSTVTARDEHNRVVWRERLDHRDRQQLRGKLQKWPRGTPVVLEATFGWGWLSDELQAAGLDPRLASSSKVAAWRRARGLAKSNRTDADLLSELWSQQPRWWEVWLAPPEVREQREWLRYRMTLVRTQTGLKNRIHAILHRHGIIHEYADLFGAQGRRFLSLLVAPNDVTLPEGARATLKGYVQLLDHVRRQVAGATREFRRQVNQSPDARHLLTIPGISWILGYTIMAEVGRIERFPSARHLASYSLLAPMAHDSGDETDEPPQGRHVGFVGRRTLKWAWIEAAHSAVCSGGRWRQIFDRRTNAGKRDRNRGYIAVAHDLCRVAYVCWSRHVDYTETPPGRPGSTTSKSIERQERTNRRRDPGQRPASARMKVSASSSRESRPGTGQPDPAMVAVVDRRP